MARKNKGEVQARHVTHLLNRFSNDPAFPAGLQEPIRIESANTKKAHQKAPTETLAENPAESESDNPGS